MSEEKIFCGSGKIVQTRYGELTKISFSESDIEKLKNNLSNGWINLVFKEKKNKVEGKPTHYLQVDTWKPSENSSSSEKPNSSPEITNNDLPF